MTATLLKEIENMSDQVDSTVEDLDLDNATDQDSDYVQEDDEQLDDSGNPVVVEDEDEEVEHDGQKYKVPKALKPLLMMQGDYTQKTQALAEQRRAIEAQAQQTHQLVQQNIADIGKVASIDERLQQFSQLNWQALSEADPLQAQKLYFDYQQLKDTRVNVVSAIQQREAQHQTQQQQRMATEIEEGNKVLAKELPGWGAELAREILDFANKDLGYPMHELQQITDPRIVKVLHAAMIGNKVLKKQPTTKTAPEAKPVKTVGKTQAATGIDINSSKTNTDAWMKARNAQMNKKRR